MNVERKGVFLSYQALLDMKRKMPNPGRADGVGK
jgi:hypothetical protein